MKRATLLVFLLAALMLGILSITTQAASVLTIDDMAKVEGGCIRCRLYWRCGEKVECVDQYCRSSSQVYCPQFSQTESVVEDCGLHASGNQCSLGDPEECARQYECVCNELLNFCHNTGPVLSIWYHSPCE